MKRNSFFLLGVAIALLGCPFSCTSDATKTGGSEEYLHPEIGSENEEDRDNSHRPDFDYTIAPYDGELATDSEQDVVGTDSDLYWELNEFPKQVVISYEGDQAIVEGAGEQLLSLVEGADVVIDMQTHSLAGVEIVLKGQSDNGSLKIYGEKKFKLTLAGVDLTSQKGPAINSQCKKRVFVHLEKGTTNRLTDASEYQNDHYYRGENTVSTEDRKGALFTEGDQIFSGSGTLVVAGRQKHAVATDGYFYMRPGVTLAITEAVKNGLHVKGDEEDDRGIHLMGGLLYVCVDSPAGKCIKCDRQVEIAGGKQQLYASGDALYDAEEKDTSSAAGIKTDGDILVRSGELNCISTGRGGKGLNADGAICFEGGATSVATSGGKYQYRASLTSSPKGIRADGDIILNGGSVNISVSGVSDGSEGLESKSSLTINGGALYVEAYDDAINAAKSITVNGGRLYAYATNNDAIDSNGTLTVNGGLLIASGGGVPEEGFDSDRSENFKITGGILIGTGGTAQAPSSSSTQRTVVYNGISATEGTLFAIVNSAGEPLLCYELPRSMNGMSLLFSAPGLEADNYTVYQGGSVGENDSCWNGWYEAPNYTAGTLLETFSVSSAITTVGQNNGQIGGGGNPGGPGGGRPR